MTTIDGNFIGTFKIGDNIQYNLSTLSLLYKYFDEEDEDGKYLLIKPIHTIISSIIEAILYDFRGRVRSHTREKSVKIPEGLIELFKKAPNDKLGFLIDQARKHKIFENNTKNICEELDLLRQLRNRIHIQNSENHKPRDESNAFNETAKKQAEELLKYIMNYMSKEHPRPKWAHFGQEFVLPF